MIYAIGKITKITDTDEYVTITPRVEDGKIYLYIHNSGSAEDVPVEFDYDEVQDLILGLSGAVNDVNKGR